MESIKQLHGLYGNWCTEVDIRTASLNGVERKRNKAYTDLIDEVFRVAKTITLNTYGDLPEAERTGHALAQIYFETLGSLSPTQYGMDEIFWANSAALEVKDLLLNYGFAPKDFRMLLETRVNCLRTRAEGGGPQVGPGLKMEPAPLKMYERANSGYEAVAGYRTEY